MTPDQAFLLAICTEPADDAPRLAYADYLEERGDPRGEFVCVQCALARLDEPDKSCPYLDNYRRSSVRWREGICQCRGCGLVRRARELLRSHSLLWLHGIPLKCVEYKEEGPIPTVAAGLRSSQTLDTDFTFRRGFVVSISLPHQAFLDHAAALFAAQPIEKVCLTDKDGGLFTTWFRTSPCAEYGIGDDKSNLDARIFDYLQGGKTGKPEGPQPHAVCWRTYGWRGRQRSPSHADGASSAMLADLSQACVAWGRQQAGLPALASSHSVVIG